MGFAGRGIVKIGDLGLEREVLVPAATPEAETNPPPLERPTSRIRTADGRLGVAEAAPDERLFVTLDDGQSLLVNAGEVTVLEEPSPNGED